MRRRDREAELRMRLPKKTIMVSDTTKYNNVFHTYGIYLKYTDLKKLSHTLVILLNANYKF